jgi:hypothetical protein
MTAVDDKVARRDELGTITGIYPDAPEWFEGDWPQGPPRGMAIVKWPGRKKLTVEPISNLITVKL